MEDSKRLPRKLAAILYADVAGYSRLTGEDEDATHRTLSEYLDLISLTVEQHRGRVMHYAGDAVLAMFDAVIDAIACASTIQGDLKARSEDLAKGRRLNFRIGLNLGDVIEDRGDIYGDGVNIAARLESLAEPGGICISGTVHDAIGNKLPIQYEFMGEQQVKNIEKPVRAYRVLLDTKEDMEATSSGPPALEPPDKPSIAVLPFTNMSGDPEQEYFSDGITEDIITELSRFPTLFVIARHSSFAFRAQTIDVKEIGGKLGVRYIVEGSVRTAGNRMRITAQLIDAATGNHIWAERYDRATEDIFDVQDEVTSAIVATLPGQIEKSVVERAGRKRTESMTAYDCLLRGNKYFHRLTHEDLLEARRLYQKAIELDPQFAQAISHLAAVDNLATALGWEAEDLRPDTMETVQRALALDSDDNWSRLVLGWTLLRQQRFDESEEQFEKALALNRNDAECVAWVALAFVFLGRADEASELVNQAMRLNPLHQNYYHMVSGHAAFFTGRYDDAARDFKQGREYGIWHHANLAAAYGQMGRVEEARAEAAMFVEARRRHLESNGTPFPASELELAARRMVRIRRQNDRDRYLDGLRKAGLTG
ncbi:MAG: adenylate/guanylate cyclase domain-containing protein [Gammaproteobacteria bacterium]|nr:MAG: adenylate/guanylate cyclase domain-containing protein [Gammaproteobacteria bacterium]